MKKRFFAVLIILVLATTVFAAGWYNPKDTIETPLSSRTWDGVQFWNGGGLVLEMTDVQIKVVTMYSSAGWLASEKNTTSWIVYQVTGNLKGSGRVTRNIIDSEALSIVFW